MKKLLLISTGSVAIVKMKKLSEILAKHFELKIVVSDYVQENYSELDQMNIEEPDGDLLSFPKHIQLAKWADLILVAPATADTLAKFRAGIADGLHLNILIAARCQIIFAPAMNTFMYKSILKRNILNNLSEWGHPFIGPEVGVLKEGESGLGRMSEPEDILKYVINWEQGNGKKVIVTYGSTKVKIDKIRYISSYSSGKMGKLIMNQLRLKGFVVEGIDVSKYSNEEVVDILENKKWDIYISAAAFANNKAVYQDRKIPHEQFSTLQFEEDIDVLRTISKKYPNRKIIGFKHDDDINKAIKKKEELNLEFMIWNKIGAMNNDFISGSIIGANFDFENISKKELAIKISEVI